MSAEYLSLTTKTTKLFPYEKGDIFILFLNSFLSLSLSHLKKLRGEGRECFGTLHRLYSNKKALPTKRIELW